MLILLQWKKTLPLLVLFIVVVIAGSSVCNSSTAAVAGSDVDGHWKGEKRRGRLAKFRSPIVISLFNFITFFAKKMIIASSVRVRFIDNFCEQTDYLLESVLPY